VLVDSLIIPECVYRPGTFTGLMTLYESNYIKLHNLTAAFDWPSDVVISASPEDIDLHATIMRREPYTTTLKLTYWFPEAEDVTVADPDLILRVYHDARARPAVARKHDAEQVARLPV
jgi:uncharacterized protein YqiB (DUF1249 family)